MTLVSDDTPVDTVVVTTADDLALLDDLVRQAEEMCTVAVDPERSIFSKTEVVDLMLDMRSLLVKTRDALASNTTSG